MGSTKYPGENTYSDWITKHGGDSNAFTEYEFTNYQFRVDLSGLQTALDMHAHLFTTP